MIINPIFIDIPKSWEIVRDTPSNKNKYPILSFGKTFDETYDYHTLFSGVIKYNNSLTLVAPPFLNIQNFIEEKVDILDHDTKIKLNFLNLDRCSISTTDINISSNYLNLTHNNITTEVLLEQSYIDDFKNKKIMFTMFKNDNPEYIKHWIDYHNNIYDIECFILFNNNSDKYTTEDLYKFLNKKNKYLLIIVNWPMKWGVNGPPWNADFCKIVALQYLKYKFAYESKLVVNLDIDEYLVSSYSLDDIEKKILENNATTLLFESKNISMFTTSKSKYKYFKDYYWFHDETVNLNKMYKWITIPKLTQKNQWSTHNILDTQRYRDKNIDYAHISSLVGEHHIINNTKTYNERCIIKLDNNKINNILKSNFEKINSNIVINNDTYTIK